MAHHDKATTDTKRHLQLPTKEISRKRDYSPWSRLSAELRNEIYTYVLTYDEPIRITRILNPWEEPEWILHNKQLPNMSLCFINKATYAEAMPLFCELNTFHFSGPETLDLFMKAFPEKLMPHLRHLIISTTHTEISPDEAFLPLIKATNLTCVEIKRWGYGRTHIELENARRRRAIEMYGPVPSAKKTSRRSTQSIRRWRDPSEMQEWVLSHIVAYFCKMGGFQRWMKTIGDAKGDPRAGANVVCLSQELIDQRLERKYHRMRPLVMIDEIAEFRTILGDMLTNLLPNLGE